MGKSKKNQINFRSNDCIRNFSYCSQRSRGRYQENTVHRSYGRNYVFRQNQYKNYRKNKFKKVRPLSPVLGSSEHMNKKIEETSAIIMQHLLNPDEAIASCTLNEDNDSSAKSLQPSNELSNVKPEYCNKIKKKISHKNNKIQEKILNHLNNLTEGKKKNLINSDKSEYDFIIQQIMREKRLEISRTLRNVFSNPDKLKHFTDSSTIVNPDVGIIVEDLPQYLISELRQVLNFEIAEADKDTIDNCPDDVLLNVLNTFIRDLNTSESYSTLNKNKYEEKTIENGHMSDKQFVNTFQFEIENKNTTQTLHHKCLSKSNIKFEMPTSCDSIINEIKEEYNFIENNTIIDEDIHIKLEPEEYFNESRNEETQSVNVGKDNYKIMKSFDIKNNEITQKMCNVSIQTENTDKTMSLHQFIGLNLEEIPSSFNEAIRQMYEIDNWIAQLTTYRQNIFLNLCSLSKDNQLKL